MDSILLLWQYASNYMIWLPKKKFWTKASFDFWAISVQKIQQWKYYLEIAGFGPVQWLESQVHYPMSDVTLVHKDDVIFKMPHVTLLH